jgi:hypothetical protein
VNEKPPFDFVKASFFLVAGVIAVHCAIVLAGVVFCWTHESSARCDDLRGNLIELLAAALAAALAFAGAKSR